MGGFHFHGDGEGAAGEWFSSEKGANLEGFKTALAQIPLGPRAIGSVADSSLLPFLFRACAGALACGRFRLSLLAFSGRFSPAGEAREKGGTASLEQRWRRAWRALAARF
ncbi:hypothetical protein [Ottowia massiliensis]|uniref:hypothetical protein n=1 Tax=Ottowia massiliensis TaxID=2045302 RepID=UPI0011AFA2E3|nr:hypothetical protein [Ottowia massiliensis]